MDFSLSEETQALLQKTRSLLDEVVLPLERAALADFASVSAKLESARQIIKDAGLWAPQMPQEYGGIGLGFLDHALMSEILGRSPIGHYVFGCPAPDAGNQEILHKFGSDEQKAKWLRPLVAGRIRSCFSMTEPERAGSNPTWLDTRERRRRLRDHWEEMVHQ